jgi:hypothetical protein
MERGPTLDRLRAEVQRAIRETSGRALARELGCSPTALLAFAKTPDATVYGKTYRKLVPWFERRIPDAVGPGVDIRNEREVGPDEVKRVRKEIARMLKRAFPDQQGVDQVVDASLGG